MLQRVRTDNGHASRAEPSHPHSAGLAGVSYGVQGICGWADPGVTVRPGIAEGMVARMARRASLQSRSASTMNGSLAVCTRGSEGDIFADAQVGVAVSGRIRFADSDLARLAAETGPARAVAAGYSRRGAGIFERLGGAFEIAIVSRRGTEALLAIDRMGIGSLCYESVASAFAFASSLEALAAFPGSSGEISLQSIHDYVYFHMVPAPQTIYARRHRLLPGTYAHFKNGVVRADRYWEMRFVENERRSFSELKTEFRGLLHKSVAAMAQQGHVGAFLSGGTDSSTVTGMLRDITGEAPRTYSIGFEAKGFDEMVYARIAAKHFGARHQEYYVTPHDVVAAIPCIAAIHDQPFGNSSAVPTYYCAKLASDDGMSTLLAGDGGDELFGGNARYATQRLYALYSDLPGVVRRAIEPAIGVLPSIGLLGKAQRYVAHASKPMPARYDNYNLLDRLGSANVFTGGFLDAVNPRAPATQFADAYAGAKARSLINQMLALDLKFTLADNDLPKVRGSCDLAGVNVLFPLLDDALVAFSARVPPGYKLRGTRLRYFFKRSLADFLPPEIIKKRKHGFGLPFGIWLQSQPRLRAIAYDSLADLKKRRIVRSEFIDSLVGVQMNEHPNYYGTMVWILMMLEQWYCRRSIAEPVINPPRN